MRVTHHVWHVHSKVKRDLLDVETALIGATSGAFTNDLLALISVHMLSGRSSVKYHTNSSFVCEWWLV